MEVRTCGSFKPANPEKIMSENRTNEKKRHGRRDDNAEDIIKDFRNSTYTIS